MDRYLIESCNRFLTEDEGPTEDSMKKVADYIIKFNKAAKSWSGIIFDKVKEDIENGGYIFSTAIGDTKHNDPDYYDSTEKRIIANTVTSWIEENLGDLLVNYAEPSEESFKIYDEMLSGEYDNLDDLIEIGEEIFQDDFDMIFANSTPSARDFKEDLGNINSKFIEVMS